MNKRAAVSFVTQNGEYNDTEGIVCLAGDLYHSAVYFLQEVDAILNCHVVCMHGSSEVQ